MTSRKTVPKILDYLLMMQLFIARYIQFKDQVILQNDLAKLAEWEQLWGMEFHPRKCSYLKISRSRKPKTYKYILKGVTLAEVTSNQIWRGIIPLTELRKNLTT